MPFQYVLANVLSDVPSALAVAFLDEEGETVAMITSENSHEEIKIFSAYQGIFLHHLQKILKEKVTFYFYRTEANICYNHKVGDNYYMVLIAREVQPVERVRRIMDRARVQIEEHAL